MVVFRKRSHIIGTCNYCGRNVHREIRNARPMWIIKGPYVYHRRCYRQEKKK